MYRPLLALLVCFSLLSACASQQDSNGDEPSGIVNPYQPQPGDDTMQRGNVYLDAVDVLILESYPLQIDLAIQGSLPTPCHHLRVVASKPDQQNRIMVEMYSLVDPDLICVQVLEPVQATIALGSFPSGHYTVWVNSEQVGEFDA